MRRGLLALVLTLLAAVATTSGALAVGAATTEHHHPVVKVHPVQAHKTAPRITEDDPRWNCLTMGNRRCGPGYVPLDDTAHPEVWVDMLASEDPTVNPSGCKVSIGDTTWIVCADGYVTSS